MGGGGGEGEVGPDSDCESNFWVMFRKVEAMIHDQHDLHVYAKGVICEGGLIYLTFQISVPA